jgi:hypothetical protein
MFHCTSLQVKKQSSFEFKLTCGEDEGRFEIGLYHYTDPNEPTQSSSSHEKAMESGYPQHGDLHQVVDMHVP